MRGSRARDLEHDAHVQVFSARNGWCRNGEVMDIVSDCRQFVGDLGGVMST